MQKKCWEFVKLSECLFNKNIDSAWSDRDIIKVKQRSLIKIFYFRFNNHHGVTFTWKKKNWIKWMLLTEWDKKNCHFTLGVHQKRRNYVLVTISFLYVLSPVTVLSPWMRIIFFSITSFTHLCLLHTHTQTFLPLGIEHNLILMEI